MAVLSARTVYAPGREPPKAEIIQLLEQLFNVASGPSVVRQTKAALDLVTPAAETYGGIVLNDPTPANNGYYYRSGSAWVFGRPFPDTFAEVALSGSGTAQTGAVDTGVNPSGVEVYFARVTTPNTGPMTLSISGEAARDVVNLAGNPLSAGEWTGMVMFYLNDADQYQLLIDAGAAAAAAASATFADERADEADAAAIRAENAAASVIAAATNFKTVAVLLSDTTLGYTGSAADVEVDVGDIVTAQGFRYEVVAGDAVDAPLQTEGGVLLRPLLDFVGAINAGAFGYRTETGEDMRQAAQAAIDYAESLGTPVTVVFPGGNAVLKSVCPEASLPSSVSGQKIGLVLRKPNKVKIWGLGARVSFDLSAPAVQAADVLFAVPSAQSDAAFLSMEGISFFGTSVYPGNRSHWPKNVFRADYATTAYAYVRDMEVHQAREDTFVIRGYVVEMTNVRAVWAGAGHSNFWFHAPDSGGAVTAYSLRRCVADYAGLYGYRFSGNSGHTYCHLDTCAADHIGRDQNNQTISGVETTSFAYSFEAVRNIVMTACGAEWCNSSIRLAGARTFEVNGFYGVNNGSTNGVTVPASISVADYFERVNISAFEENAATNIAKRLRLTNVNAFNTNALTLDHSIAREDIEFVGGNKSAARALVFTPTDFYREGGRWDGGGLIYGDRLVGNPGANWFNRDQLAARQTFRKTAPAGGGGISVLEILDSSSDGNLWAVLEVIVGRNSGGNFPPSRYQVVAACQGINRTVSAEKIGTVGFNFTVSAQWSGQVLQVVVGQEFAIVFIEATVMAAQNTGNGKFFQWA